VRQDHQLIVVDPDLVILPQLRQERFGKLLVDLDIRVEVLILVIRQRSKIVKKGPENGVGKAVVVIVIQVFIHKYGQDPEVLFGRMGSRGLVPILLGKIRHTHPHFFSYFPLLSGRILEIAFNG